MVKTSKYRINGGKFWLLLLIILILILGTLISWRLAINTGNEMRHQFLHEANRAASALSKENIERLSGSEQDTLLSEYQRLKNQLKAIRFVKPERRFVYIMGQKRDGNADLHEISEDPTVLILIDSEPWDSENHSPPGQTYEEISIDYRKVFQDRKATVSSPVTDRWGKWITALVPMSDVKNEQYDVVLGIDIDAHRWNRIILLKSVVPAGLTTAALIVVLLLGVNWVKQSKKRTINLVFVKLIPEAVVITVLGVAISLFTAWLIHDKSKRGQFQSFQQMAESRIAIFEDAVTDLWTMELEGLARFFEGSEYVTSPEFLKYTSYLTDNRFVKAWMWVEMVPISSLEAFYAMEFEMNSTEISIWKEDVSGLNSFDLIREFYFPITRIAPMGLNERFLGFDLGADPVMHSAITRALETGLITAAFPQKMGTSMQINKQLLVIRPVYSYKGNNEPEGLVMALLDVEELFTATIPNNYIIGELAFIANEDLLESSLSSWNISHDISEQMVYSGFVFAYGKNKLISVYPTQAFYNINSGSTGIFIAIAGILVSLLITVIVSNVRQRHQDLESLVQKQTSDLKASQENLAATLRSIGDGVITCDRNSTVVSINKAAELLTGWLTDEAFGRKLEEVFPIIDSRTGKSVDNPVDFVLESGETVDMSNHIVLISRNGQKYNIADSCAPIRDENNRVSGAVLVFRDVTEAYYQREELAEERERLQNILKITGTGINIVDSEYNLLYVDKGTVERLGDPTNKKCYEYFKGKKEACEFCNIQKALKTKRNLVCEQNCHQGSDKLYEVHTIPFQNKDGIWVAAEMKLDITERKRAENELQQQRLMLRTVIDNLPACIYVKDTEARKIVSNIADLNNLGFEKEEDVLGKTDMDMMPKKEAEAYYEDDLKVLKKGISIIEKEERFKKPNGETIWLSTSKIPLVDNDGKIVGLVGIGHDVTQTRKQAEELMSAKEKAEEGDKLKTAFLHNMSHEIRTPLNAITGFADMLASAKLEKEKQNRYISIIRNSSRQLLAIVNDILTISSIETKQERINLEALNINEIIEDLYTVFKFKADDKNVSFTTKKWFVDEEAIVYADKTKVTQVLSNLLSNAVKFTDSGHIQLGYTYKKTSNELEFYVKDSGIGVASEFHDLIFERFRQADDAIHQNYSGTGLGLSICKGFAVLMNGKISLESKPGLGSTFYFSIPFQPLDTSAGGDEIERENASSETDFVVLVAEDDELSTLFLTELLTENGCKVIHTGNGEKAVELFKQNKVDLVLMDIRMPGMNGLQAAAEMRNINNTVPIVAQTAYSLSVEALNNKVFNDFIMKPMEPNKIKELLNKYRRIDDSC